ncbi:MAG TPA: DciA family protein [Nocardioidaceae bacterium]|nr:DciA family protein [Nocardioidaceae bacterium]
MSDSEPDPAQPDPAQADSAASGAEHDESGLQLARAVARSMAGGLRRTAGARRTTSPTEQARRRRGTGARSSGAHPDDRDPQLLDATIDRLVSEHGWSTDVAVHGVFGRWDSIVGAEVAQHCHPERFADERLTVRADSTAWATQVRMLAPTVVRRLNEELGDDTVARIEVLGPHRPSWSKGGRTLRDARGPRDTYG